MSIFCRVTFRKLYVQYVSLNASLDYGVWESFDFQKLIWISLELLTLVEHKCRVMANWALRGMLEVNTTTRVCSHIRFWSEESLMRSVRSCGSSSLLFIMKVMVLYFVSDTHKVVTALISCLFSKTKTQESLPSKCCCGVFPAIS
jgi:hypothetical protein